MQHIQTRRTTIVLFSIYLVLLIGVIIFKLPFFHWEGSSVRVVNLIPLQDALINGRLSMEVIYNVLLFIPLGVYLVMLRPNWHFRQWFGFILVTTLSFEVIQFIFAIGISDITDVFANALGGVIGVSLGLVIIKVLKQHSHRVINLLATLCTVSAFAFLGFMLFRSYFKVLIPIFI